MRRSAWGWSMSFRRSRRPIVFPARGEVRTLSRGLFSPIALLVLLSLPSGVWAQAPWPPPSFEEDLYSEAALLGGSLDFHPSLERCFFNAAHQRIAVRGIFTEGPAPVGFFLNGTAVSPRLCGGSAAALLPVWGPGVQSAEVRARPDLGRGPGSGGTVHLRTQRLVARGPEVRLKAGDETGDALMLDFLDDAPSVGNRGSLLAVEAGTGRETGPGRRWWVRGQYLKDDWLAYRRHGIRTPVAPVESGRENIGTLEKGMAGGGIEWRRGSWTVVADWVGQAFPALWIRDAGTWRTTQWEGWSGFGAVRARRERPTGGWRVVEVALSVEGTSAGTVHVDPEMDARWSRRVERVSVVAEAQPAAGTTVRQGIVGQLEHARVEPEGETPSHGFSGPARLASGGVYLALRQGFFKSGCLWIEGRLDKREGTPAYPSLDVGTRIEWRPGFLGWVRFIRSGQTADPFQVYGASRVVDGDLGPEFRFEGRLLDPETATQIEAGVSSRLGGANLSLTLFRKTVDDGIAAHVEEWAVVEHDLERVRSGFWANGFQTTSTGLEVALYRRARWGEIRAFAFRRDLEHHTFGSDIHPPPVGASGGGGVAAVVRLPKAVRLSTRVRAVGAPQFAPYGGWTEPVGLDRVRWDAALAVPLSRSWRATLTALDILDEGHIEVPAGNPVGFRVSGVLCYAARGGD